MFEMLVITAVLLEKMKWNFAGRARRGSMSKQAGNANCCKKCNNWRVENDKL